MNISSSGRIKRNQSLMKIKLPIAESFNFSSSAFPVCNFFFTLISGLDELGAFYSLPKLSATNLRLSTLITFARPIALHLLRCCRFCIARNMLWKLRNDNQVWLMTKVTFNPGGWSSFKLILRNEFFFLPSPMPLPDFNLTSCKFFP